MNRIVSIILVVILAVGCQDEAPPVESQRLFLPKDADSTVDSTVYTDSVVTFLLIGGDSIVYYTNKIGSHFPLHETDYKEVRNVLLNFKKQLGDHLQVVIKPFPQATYKNTVDILDEMTINEIKRYKLIDLTAEEMKMFGQALPEPVAFNEARTQSGIRKKHILITLNADNSLSYSIDDLVNPVKPVKIDPPTKDRIKEIVSAYKQSLGTQGDKMNVIISGPGDAKYTSYKRIIEAMKELEWYKFTIETTPD